MHGGIPFSQLLKLLERVVRCEEEIGTGPAADGADLKKRVDSLEAILGVASEGSIVERLGAIEGLIGSEATLEAAPVAAAAPADWLAVEEAREEAERAARAEAAAEAARVQAMERAGACLAEELIARVVSDAAKDLAAAAVERRTLAAEAARQEVEEASRREAEAQARREAAAEDRK